MKISKGHTEITVKIKYPSKGYPSIEQLRIRHKLEQKIDESGAGEVTGAESGESVMMVYLETKDVPKMMSLIRQIVTELGTRDQVLIDISTVN